MSKETCEGSLLVCIPARDENGGEDEHALERQAQQHQQHRVGHLLEAYFVREQQHALG